MTKRRLETWVLLLVSAVGLIPVALAGLWAYVSATATPLHPTPTAVPSVTHSSPVATWADAVSQGREIVRSALSEQNLPGMSVAVGVGDDIVWAEGFGWADLETRVPIAPETSFRIGTASTALTSAAVGLLLEEGRLNLDEPIQTYVPAFPSKEWPVTLRQVMGHVAGVRNDGGDEGPLLSARCERPAHALRAFADRPLLFEPGTRYRFSSYGWIVVSAAVEAAAGEPFLAVMRQRIFEPLGLRDTTADSATEPASHRATPYFPRFAADPRYGLHLMRPLDYSCYAGSSVFISTPSDLVRFGLAITNGKLLQPATMQVLQTSQRLTSGEETGYGLGWDLETVTVAGKETRSVGHDGTLLGGPVSSLMTFPEHGIVVAVTSNISYADTPAVALGIARAFAGRGRHSEPR
jgi:CubicO group peptidase (beta-lactamase class C family)